MDLRQYLESIVPTREQVDAFLAQDAEPGRPHINRGWTYDGELGWVHTHKVLADGVDGSTTFYSYEADGARTIVNSAGQPCRIHCYGDSMTHCDQVSDGETWAEYLAAHLREPVRNYGVGGYSIYQAYRRMLRVEKENPAEYIIFGITDDDHYRNLDAWRTIRFGRRTSCGFTLPHVRVNVDKDEFEEVENVCPTPQDVYKLCDKDFVWETFKDDPVAKVAMASRPETRPSSDRVDPVAVSFGFPPDQLTLDAAGNRLRDMHTPAALYSTRRIMELVEKFCEENNKKLLAPLIHLQRNLESVVGGKPRFDQTFADWIKGRGYPVVDLLEALIESHGRSNLSIQDYGKSLFNGHCKPCGNYFFAWSMMESVVHWLDPKPASRPL